MPVEDGATCASNLLLRRNIVLGVGNFLFDRINRKIITFNSDVVSKQCMAGTGNNAHHRKRNYHFFHDLMSLTAVRGLCGSGA